MTARLQNHVSGSETMMLEIEETQIAGCEYHMKKPMNPRPISSADKLSTTTKREIPFPDPS